MNPLEVPDPILCSPFQEPPEHWYIREGETPVRRPGRRPALVYPPRDDRKDRRTPWSLADGTLQPSTDYAPAFELTLVNLIRDRVADWRRQDYPGTTRTTYDLLHHWRRDGRQCRLFFAQLEAAETVIFLTEARADFRQGIAVPRDDPGDDARAQGHTGFRRLACKMATGAGKTTVMGMLAAWSILNKLEARSDARFSDVVLVVCPNVTIRTRLRELDPHQGDASIYATRDLVPAHLRTRLTQGRVLVTNWHVFEPQAVQVAGESARVNRSGQELRTRETIHIGPKTTTARGTRYLTQEDYDRQRAAGILTPLKEEHDAKGNLVKVQVESVRHVESDTALVNRLLGREVGGKQNILVMNDEAHHAYRIRPDADPEQADLYPDEDEEDVEDFAQEATVWVEGLDRIHKLRGINFCLDLSATPFFLARVGQETNRPFPWVVSDFGLIDAIESGMVKVPQLAVRDSTGAEVPGYFNIWNWILPQMTSGERGGSRASPKAEAVLKYAHVPIAMLGGLWENEWERWRQRGEPRPPVFILVCKNTAIARVLYEWLADGNAPRGIPPSKLDAFRNRPGEVNTIRVDSKVVHETDTGQAKSDESRWMRLTLDTAGKTAWPTDRQGRPVYPPDFEDLAVKLGRPLHPPGRDVRCIVSVGMLTEGWDCSTVTHIIGLRPFMSQLLCEQVVGRGLRRTTYEFDDNDRLPEEVAKVFGVPFEVIPFKATGAVPPKPVPRAHIHALPARAAYEIRFPRVEGYTQAIRNRLTIDWTTVPTLTLDPGRIPPEVEMKALSISNKGRLCLSGPGRVDDVTLADFRDRRRLQELVFDLARELTRGFLAQGTCQIPAHVLFPQVAVMIRHYLDHKVKVHPPSDLKDIFLSPYYGWLVEYLLNAIRPDTSQGEAPEIPLYETHRPPGTTADVDFWTTKDVREVQHSHVNYVVADTLKWEQSAACILDRHPRVEAFVKNAGLGFAIPYLDNGQPREYVPDFLIRLKGDSPTHLILEVKGYDPLEEVKHAAAHRWISAVNAEGSHDCWKYLLVHKPGELRTQLVTTGNESDQANLELFRQ